LKKNQVKKEAVREVCKSKLKNVPLETRKSNNEKLFRQTVIEEQEEWIEQKKMVV
jgi:hypothetical protein